ADVYQTTSPVAPAVFKSATVALSISQKTWVNSVNAGAGVSVISSVTAVRATLSQSSLICAALYVPATRAAVGAKAVPPVADVYQTTSPVAPAVFKSATVALSISQNVCVNSVKDGAGVSVITTVTSVRATLSQSSPICAA